jgi:nucleoid-associated protein YejK
LKGEKVMEAILEATDEVEIEEIEKRTFAVDRLALHLVDPLQPEPIYSAQEVDLASYPDKHKAAIEEYFENHLLESWKASESTRTAAAMFSENSVISQYYKEIIENKDNFYKNSRSIAKHFHDIVVDNKNILAGLLITVHSLKLK